MKKNDKINILDDLIKRTTELVCRDSASANAVIRETFSFIRNALKGASESAWEGQIKAIQWIPSVYSDVTPPSVFERAWLSGKKELHNVLESIKKEIELYTQDEDEQFRSESSKNDNDPIIFISHSSSDKPYGDALQKFIMGLGIEKEQLIYTSHELHKIPQGADIYEYLREKIYKGVSQSSYCLTNT